MKSVWSKVKAKLTRENVAIFAAMLVVFGCQVTVLFAQSAFNGSPLDNFICTGAGYVTNKAVPLVGATGLGMGLVGKYALHSDQPGGHSGTIKALIGLGGAASVAPILGYLGMNMFGCVR